MSKSNASPFSQETKITLEELLCCNWNEIEPVLLTLDIQNKEIKIQKLKLACTFV